MAQKRRGFRGKPRAFDIYSRRVNGNSTLASILKNDFPWCSMWEKELGRLFRAYVERKLERNLLDYDDLLLYWYHMLEDPGLAATLGGLFDHILVDEYQDTNAIQAGVLSRMREKNENITVVGDDAAKHLQFPIGDGAQHPGFSSPVPGVHYRNPRPQLPLEDADPEDNQPRDRAGAGKVLKRAQN